MDFTIVSFSIAVHEIASIKVVKIRYRGETKGLESA